MIGAAVSAALIVGVAYLHARWLAKREYRRGRLDGYEGGYGAGRAAGEMLGAHRALEQMSRQHGNALLTNLAAEALAEISGRKPN